MRDRRRFGERGRWSWLGDLIRHDPELARMLFLFGCVAAYASYATGQLQLFLADLKAALVARLTAAVAPLDGDVGVVALAGLAIALLCAGIGVMIAPDERPRGRKELILGKGRSGTFTVRPDERRAHLTVVGLSGMGKSKAVASWVSQDILRERETSIVLDIHQTLIDDVLGLVGDRIEA
jgi:hypothetical protein